MSINYTIFYHKSICLNLTKYPKCIGEKFLLNNLRLRYAYSIDCGPLKCTICLKYHSSFNYEYIILLIGG